MRLNEKQIALLSGSSMGGILGEEGILNLADFCDIRRRPAGGRFFQEGDVASGLFLILSGKVKLMRLSRDGHETVLHIAEPPAMIAEAAIFMGKYPATAEAVEDAELLFLPKKSVLDLVEKNGRFARLLIDSMTMWLRRLVGKIEALTTSDASARLSRFLLDLHEKTPPRITLTSPKVVLPVKKGELAQLLNMQLPSLSRIFKKMHDEGLIDVDGKTITLRNLAALRRMTLPPLE